MRSLRFIEAQVTDSGQKVKKPEMNMKNAVPTPSDGPINMLKCAPSSC
jgi:hypothetical protein